MHTHRSQLRDCSDHVVASNPRAVEVRVRVRIRPRGAVTSGPSLGDQTVSTAILPRSHVGIPDSTREHWFVNVRKFVNRLGNAKGKSLLGAGQCSRQCSEVLSFANGICLGASPS